MKDVWLTNNGHLLSLTILALSVIAAAVAHGVVYAIAARAAKRTPWILDDALVRHSRGPVRLLFPVVTVLAVSSYAPLPQTASAGLRHMCTLLLIAGFAHLLVKGVSVLDDLAGSAFRIDAEDNLLARQIHTQLAVTRRVVIVLVTLVAAALMLMTFPRARELGASLLASAGVAGLVIGMAARPTVANLIAGVQIAMTQPIRIDDVVIIEGEWGRIEEIRATYVVIRIWDLRRLVVPLSHFIESPFQNWTRTSSEILGTAFVHVDYRVPVEQVRAELKRVLDASDLWDGKVCGLQVTDATANTVQLRALMSASNASKAWDLRCHVREKLIDYLQRDHPAALPRTRAEIAAGRLDGDNSAAMV